MESNLKKNLLWDYLNRFGNTIVGLITSTILARLLSPADYGLVGISMAINGIASIFFNLGFGSSIIQSKEIDKNKLSSVFFLNIFIAIIIYGTIFFFASWISLYYKLPKLELIVKVSALYFFITAINVVPNALLVRGMKFKELAIVNLLGSLAGGLVGLFLAISNFGVWSIVFQQLVIGVVMVFGVFRVSKWIPYLHFKLNELKDMLKFGLYLFFSSLLDGIYSRIDLFLIAKVFSPASLGQYTRAQSFDGMIRSLSSGSLLNVLFPTFARVRDDKELLKTLYYKYFQLISFLFCLLAGIFYLSSDLLFDLLFGPQWQISADYFKILVLSGFAYPLSSLSLSIIEARGNSKSFFIVEVIKKILFLPTYYIAYSYGIMPYLFSFVIASYLGTFINVRFLKFELQISVWKTVKYLSRYILYSLAIILSIKYFQFHMNYIPTIKFVMLEMALFILIYLGLNLISNSKGLEYSLALIKRQI